MAEYKGNYFREDFKTYDQGDWLTGTWSNAKNSWNQASTRAENVTHDRNDDTLTLRLGAENDRGKEYNGASVQTKDYFHFGIYEINMKASGVHGVNSNFFTFTGKQQGTIKNEIDFEFLGKTPTKVWTSFHSPNANAAEGYEGRGKNVDLGFDASKGFHTYRFEWKSNSIKWYADGKLIRSVDPDKDVWLENGKYVTDYDAGNNGDTGAEMGIPQLPGKMYMNIWAGATQWMGKTPSNFSETTATYDHITYMAWDHPNAKSFGNGKSGASVKVTEPSSSKVDAVDAVYDTATAQENRSIKLDLLDNDQGDNLKITKVENVTNGTAKINGRKTDQSNLTS